MDVHFVEATNGPQNWGKFAIGRFTDDEWKEKSAVDGLPLLAGRGWSPNHTLVIDLQTGEGAFFPEWVHKSDLDKHAIWVCPMFEHALLRILDGEHDPMKTPALIDMPDAPFEWAGYRRGGPHLHALQQAVTEFIEGWDGLYHDGGGPMGVTKDVYAVIAELRELMGAPEIDHVENTSLHDAARAVSEQWTKYIGHDDVEGDDDAVAVGEAVAVLREVLGG